MNISIWFNNTSTDQDFLDDNVFEFRKLGTFIPWFHQMYPYVISDIETILQKIIWVVKGHTILLTWQLLTNQHWEFKQWQVPCSLSGVGVPCLLLAIQGLSHTSHCGCFHGPVDSREMKAGKCSIIRYARWQPCFLQPVFEKLGEKSG